MEKQLSSNNHGDVSLSRLKDRTDDGSYVHNCIIKRRMDDTSDALLTITKDDASLITKLDGYAIIPKEEYEKLLAVACA